ncbi:MAG: hypothetical protein WAL71_02225 [Terriglobales bacterium]|jgi:hypothetical protein
MDDLSVTNALNSTSPVAEVRSRHSSVGEQKDSGRRRSPYKPEEPEEDDAPSKDDAAHALDEQA